jgi:hypothetical protein
VNPCAVYRAYAIGCAIVIGDILPATAQKPPCNHNRAGAWSGRVAHYVNAAVFCCIAFSQFIELKSELPRYVYLYMIRSDPLLGIL